MWSTSGILPERSDLVTWADFAAHDVQESNRQHSNEFTTKVQSSKDLASRGFDHFVNYHRRIVCGRLFRHNSKSE